MSSALLSSSRDVEINGVESDSCKLGKTAFLMAIKEGLVEHGTGLAASEAEVLNTKVSHGSMFLVSNAARERSLQSLVTAKRGPVVMGSLSAAEDSSCQHLVGPSSRHNSDIINKTLLEAIHRVINGDTPVTAGNIKAAVKGQNVGLHKVVPVRNTPVLLRMLPSNKVVKQNGVHTELSAWKGTAAGYKSLCKPVMLKNSQCLQRILVAVNGDNSNPTTNELHRSSLLEELDACPATHGLKEEIAAGYRTIVEGAISKCCTPLLQRKDLVPETCVSHEPTSASYNSRFSDKDKKVDVSYHQPIYDAATDCKPSSHCHKDVPLLQREDLAIGGISMPNATASTCIKSSVKEENLAWNRLQFDTTAQYTTAINQPLPFTDVPLLQRADLAIDGVFPSKQIFDTSSRKKNAEVITHTASNHRASVCQPALLNDGSLFERKEQTFNGPFACRPVLDAHKIVMAVNEKCDSSNHSSEGGAVTNKREMVLPQLASLVLQRKCKTFSNVCNEKPVVMTYSRKMPEVENLSCNPVISSAKDYLSAQCKTTDPLSHFHRNTRSAHADFGSEMIDEAVSTVTCQRRVLGGNSGADNLESHVMAELNVSLQGSTHLASQIKECVDDECHQLTVSSGKQEIVCRSSMRSSDCTNVLNSPETGKHFKKPVWSEDVCAVNEVPSVCTVVTQVIAAKEEREEEAFVNDADKEKCVAATDCVLVEGAKLSCHASVPLVSHTKVQSLQQLVDAVDGGVSQKVGVFTHVGEQLMVGRVASAPDPEDEAAPTTTPTNTNTDTASSPQHATQSCKPVYTDDGSLVETALPTRDAFDRSFSMMDCQRSGCVIPTAARVEQELRGNTHSNILDITTGEEDSEEPLQLEHAVREQESVASEPGVHRRSSTHKVNGHYSGPLANPLLWKLKEEISECDMKNQMVLSQGHEEHSVCSAGQNCLDIHQSSGQYSVPLDSVPLWHVKEEMVEDIQNDADAPLHETDDQELPFEDHRSYGSEKCGQTSADVHKAMEQHAGAANTGLWSKSEKVGMLEKKYTGQKLPLQREVVGLDTTEHWCNEGEHVASEEAVHWSAEEATVATQQCVFPACKVVISVRPDEPELAQRCRRKSLEHQFDVAISPAVCVGNVMHAYESPEAASDAGGGGSVSTQRSTLVGCNRLEAARVGEDAGPTSCKRRKPAGDLSVPPPPDVSRSGGIMNGWSSGGPQGPISSQRLIGGLYADVIRETNPRTSVRGNGSWRWSHWHEPPVSKLGKLAHSSFQTFSQFRAQQQPLQSRSKRLSTVSPVAAVQQQSSRELVPDAADTCREEVSPADGATEQLQYRERAQHLPEIQDSLYGDWR